MDPNSSLLIIFLTGLTTGGLTCLAIQGSLLASVVTTDSSTLQPARKHLPLFTFLAAKLITHTILGFLLGILGTTIKLSPIYQGYFQIILGIYLFGVAGNLLKLHPLFRYFILTPPKFILKYARNISKNANERSQSITAAVLGSLTIFLPCATTQAIEVLAITAKNPFLSASMLFVFILGTVPTFLLFGYGISKGQNILQTSFVKVLGLGLLFMSTYTINAGVTLTGSVYTIQNFSTVILSHVIPGSDLESSSVLGTNSQTATINITNSGYSPRNITLKKGVTVKLNLITDKVENCSRSFTIPSLNIEKLLPETGNTLIEFTPEKLGLISFACSMGMYTGNFNVIN